MTDQPTPDFTSPIAGRIEVRQPCPYCGDRQMIPRSQYVEHVARLHPDVREGGPGIPVPDATPAARILAAVEAAMGDQLIPSARTQALDSIQRILGERTGATPPDELREQYAALFRCPPGVERLGDATPGEIADAVLTVRDTELERLRAERDHIADILADTYQVPIQTVLDDTLAALDQPTEAPAPPPPGSTRDQLPAEILALIQPDLPDYLSTACSTGQLLNCDLDQPHASERNAWAERMHQRCRLNHKFTGQLCCCDCHDERSAPAADEESLDQPKGQ